MCKQYTHAAFSPHFGVKGHKTILTCNKSHIFLEQVFSTIIWKCQGIQPVENNIKIIIWRTIYIKHLWYM